jgi:hypothetical protein
MSTAEHSVPEMNIDKKDIKFYFNTFIKSFYSKQLYIDAAQNWNSLGLLYIIFVTALCCIAYTIKFNRDYTHFITEELPYYIVDFPEIEIKNGQAHVSGKQPYIIKIEDKIFAIIDTTGKINSIDNSEALVLLTETKIITKGHDNEMKTISLEEINDFTLNGQTIINIAAQFKTFLIFFVYPSFLFFFITYNLFILLLFLPVGVIMSLHRKVTLPFRDILRLTAVALTPSIIIKALFDFSNVRLDHVWLFYFVVAVAYVSLAFYTVLDLEQQDE